MDFLENSIQYIKGVGEKRAQLFNKLGIFNVADLIAFYPRKYMDWSVRTTVANAQEDENVFIEATLETSVTEAKVRKGMTLYKCTFSDGDSVIHVTIFNNKYLAKSLIRYNKYVLYGKIEKRLTSAQMSSPMILPIEKANEMQSIYPSTEGLNSNAINKVVKTVLSQLPLIPETLDEEIRNKYHLCTLDYATRQIHSPENNESALIARNRLIFEELLTLQLGLLKLKGRQEQKNHCPINIDYTNDFIKTLPFEPTNAQKRVMFECSEDMSSNKTMNRLVQGDVGSGKTAVAASAIYSIIKNGYQAAMMAPTEILAEQHFESLNKFFNSDNIKIELLTGSTTTKEKRRIKESLASGETDLVIGTHALIQKDVEFQNLALVITDEQHRFGVAQRASLAKKGNNPHLLVMSATPIPRTLGLIIYGDLDISIIDEMPKGRQKIRTDVVDSSYHQRIYAFIRKLVDEGSQAYVVCSLVEEGESDLIPATEYAEDLSNNAFKDYNIGLLHGKMKPKEKENVMSAFSRGDIKILVSTTVIEVGVDVPNATIMLIENADRFGLSQLHQLRGRVGRGSKQSYCILVSDNQSETAKSRLQIMKENDDGFKIADYDLKARGPGDFFGKKQHGLPNLHIADMLEDIDVLKECQECAKEILKNDPELKNHYNLNKKIQKMFSLSDY